MPRNVEIKARINDINDVLSRLADIAKREPFEIEQDDTFFSCDTGRIKLRQLSPQDGALIYYRRLNEAGPKESFFVHSSTSDPVSLRELLTLAYGTVGRVIKRRIVFHLDRTRIHVDRVQELGVFLELEVALDDEEPIENGVREAEDVMLRIGMQSSQLIDRAYVDLLIDSKMEGSTLT